LAECADGLEKPRRSGYPDCIGRRAVRVRGCHPRRLPPDGGSALCDPSDPCLHPLCELQGREGLLRGFEADFKAAAEESALAALDDLAAKWGATYALGVKSWRVNWTELSTMFKYPPEIRTLIYTTNAIENFNRQLRKVTKTKSAFVSDDALLKILYLATMNITDKWTMPIRNWGTILDHLMIYFGDRVPITL
jgi:hypothetical protein